jgi:hypothetical protein
MPVAVEGIYGMLAEFDTPSDLVRAAQQARTTPAGGGWIAIRLIRWKRPRKRLAFIRTGAAHYCLVGGLMGLCAMFSLETWISTLAYPLNIAGRPTYSWPAFIIPAYEWTILFAGLSAAFGMLALNGLPSLYHPLFNAPNFRSGALDDKFFLCLESTDPKFEVATTRAFLEAQGPTSVVEVEF